ncbi:hypothetical protein T4C_5323 [Trichinella pseudospiralis]|uniref:Uncharacterized protein n=1 Tax=Trichinella pseudospiralis TaxID=6337 RepID=A0A0V1JVZ2_TRIPS|nr:hypothetical protein T4C_5323 [Trichinella pseudospiralis]
MKAFVNAKALVRSCEDFLHNRSAHYNMQINFQSGVSYYNYLKVKWRLLFRTVPCLFRVWLHVSLVDIFFISALPKVFQPLYDSRPEGQAPTVFLNFNAEPPWDPDPRDNY